MRSIVYACIICFFASCSSRKPTILSTSTNNWIASDQIASPFFDITESSNDKSYGLTPENPVKVGEMSASNQRRYLAALAGPNGENISFYRIGSCCPYKSENAIYGEAFIDIYAISYDGLKEPINIYISFYDYEELLIPVGFRRRDF